MNRFANSRCRPPGLNKPIIPPPDRKNPNSIDDDIGSGTSSDNNNIDEFDKNPFKNTGW